MKEKNKEKQKENLELFITIGKTLTSSLELNEVLNQIMEHISMLIKPKNWSLMLLDESTGELYFQILVGKNIPEDLKKKRIKVGEGIAGWVAKTGEALFVSSKDEKDMTKPQFSHIIQDFETNSLVCVPLKSKGRVLGIIELVKNKGEEILSEDEKKLLMTLADYAAIAIENAMFFKKVQELSIKDDVTGLFNSRYMHNVLDFEIKRSRRYGKPFCIIFLDIDYFKNINDTYGHLIGSQLLREVAELIKDNLREIDIATRYGGDEFVLILPETEKEGGIRVAWRIRNALKEKTFLESEGLNARITASFGVACFPDDTDNKLDLIKLSDQAMYRVKLKSRDSVEAA